MRHPFCNLSAFLGQVGLVLSTIRISAQKIILGRVVIHALTRIGWFTSLAEGGACFQTKTVQKAENPFLAIISIDI